jgi:hypothetical protein
MFLTVSSDAKLGRDFLFEQPFRRNTVTCFSCSVSGGLGAATAHKARAAKWRRPPQHGRDSGARRDERYGWLSPSARRRGACDAPWGRLRNRWPPRLRRAGYKRAQGSPATQRFRRRASGATTDRAGARRDGQSSDARATSRPSSRGGSRRGGRYRTTGPRTGSSRSPDGWTPLGPGWRARGLAGACLGAPLCRYCRWGQVRPARPPPPSPTKHGRRAKAFPPDDKKITAHAPSTRLAGVPPPPA